MVALWIGRLSLVALVEASLYAGPLPCLSSMRGAMSGPTSHLYLEVSPMHLSGNPVAVAAHLRIVRAVDERAAIAAHKRRRAAIEALCREVRPCL
jgi:hypothetical protein